MVISKTPLRVGLAGGGSDIKGFYRDYGGAVVSTSIDKYVYVAVKDRFEPGLRLTYSAIEEVDETDAIRHDLIREILLANQIDGHAEVVTMTDVPSTGTGLGSSSALAVGLLHALWARQQRTVSATDLAEGAAHFEGDLLRRTPGRQDHYAAAFGGLRLYRFGPGSAVTAERLHPGEVMYSSLGESLLLFHTGRGRAAAPILNSIDAEASDKRVRPVLAALRDLALEFARVLTRGASIEEVGSYVNHGWELKRRLSCDITSAAIDGWHNRALCAGATGGKLVGAGGHGFLLFVVPPSRQDAVRAALADLRELPFSLTDSGSEVVYSDEVGQGCDRPLVHPPLSGRSATAPGW